MLLISVAIIGFIVFVVYKPMYSVTLNGEFIGYTDDKSKLQKKIHNYKNSGDNKSIAFVEIENLPEYKLCLLQKGLSSNDDEIFDKVISSGVPYYKYYAILENGVEKCYVSTYEEAETVKQKLIDEKSKNKNDISYILKYGTELKEFTGVDAAYSMLYEKAKVTRPNKVVTTKTIDQNNGPLGIGLIEPVRGVISSRFGRRSRGYHTGLDIATSAGTPIKAAAAGVVTHAGWKGSYGKLVVIKHNDSVQTYYAHCSKIYVNVGDQVSQGQVISAIGSTGNSTGPHLHLEIRVNGAARNPQSYLYQNR